MSDKAGSQMVAAEIDPTLGEELELDLFADPTTEGGMAKLSPLARRAVGRPPNSRNKFNERAIAWLRAKYPDARERLLAIGTANPADLAALWGCKIFEAVQEQRLCLGLVLPFVAQKQPLSIDVNNKTWVTLTVVEGDGAGQTSQPIDLNPQVIDMQEFQEVSDGQRDDLGQPDLGQKE